MPPRRRTSIIPTDRLIRLAAMLGVGAALAFPCAISARDLLRPGAGGSGTAGKAVAGQKNAPGSVAAAQTGQSARDMLAKTSRAVQAVRDMQGAARSLAQKAPTLQLGGKVLPVVPNGLGAGGLKVASGVPANLAQPQAGEDPSLWQGANLPIESLLSGKTNVTITQTRQQAVLNWETFNVGKQTTVHFDQRAGTKKKGGSNDWVAINKVNDPSGVPSQILGSLRGEGAVYLINPNGIVFGGTSQVNLHSFVASSLPINDNLLTRGLLNNPDAQFLFSGLAMPAGANGTPAFTPATPSTPDGKYGDVVVQPGARLSSPTTPDHVGGRIALVGANVANSGKISSPDGQTILAAGLQVGFAAHPSSDASLRGLDVYVGAVAQAGGAAYAGLAVNRGLIDVPRANATIAGRNVVQAGAIDSSTSVTLNGRIDLIANYDAAPFPQTNTTGGLDHAPFLFRSTGSVTLAEGSVSRIVPEYDSIETVVGTKLALDSQVKVQGKTISFGKNATLFAPSATVNIDSGVWKYLGGSAPQSQFVYSGGQIHLAEGSAINVAGSAGIEALINENIISAELRGAEFADSPLQRNSILRGQSVMIDIRQSGLYNGQIWVGSPLFNAIGYVGLIQRPVGELTTNGGTVNLRSGGAVVLQKGSTVDASGGYIAYQGGMVRTSRLISGSSLLDISQATPDMVYDGFYSGAYTVDHPKYGISETFTNPILLNGLHYEEGYNFGGDGGMINIAAPAMALDGELRGRTIAGPRQRQVSPILSTLSLAFQAQKVVEGSSAFPVFSPTPPTIVFEDQKGIPSAPDFAVDALGEPIDLPESRKRNVSLSPTLLGPDGFGHLSVTNVDGDIAIPTGTQIEGLPGGSLTLAAANVDVQGNVIIAGGTLSFSAFNISPTLFQQLKVTPGAQTPAANATRGFFTLGSGASLDTAGLLVDDRAGAPDALTQPLNTAGGSVNIAAFNVALNAGSLIDVSGGLAVASNGRQSYGDAGKISIKSGQDLNLVAVLGGGLTLSGELRGYSGGRGGSLSIQAPAVQIGGATAAMNTLFVQPDFFNRGGFADFALSGLDYTVVTPGTVIAPVITSFVSRPSADDPNRLELVPFLKPPESRPAPGITLSSPGVFDDFTNVIVTRGDVKLGIGSRIEAGPLGRVTLNGQTVQVLGSVFAPGGSITISGAASSLRIFPETQDRGLVTVQLGSQSVLSTAGTTVLTPDPRGFHTGRVLAGGTISVSGNLVAEAGAVLDVSGASDVLDFRPSYSTAIDPATGSLKGLPMIPVSVESAGGAISLRGGQLLFTNATLLGAAGGPTALGGSIAVSSGRFTPPGELAKPTDVTLEVKQTEITRISPFVGTAIGKSVRGLDGKVLSQMGRFTVGEYESGGFASLNLGGTVQFSGPISIAGKGTISIADSGVLFADSAVKISAPHVVLGQAFIAPRPVENQIDPFQTGDGQKFNFVPVYGKGSLEVHADLIEIGNLSLQNIGRADLSAPGGEVRGDGTFDIAGTLTITAAQVYVPTAVNFTIAASDYTIGGKLHRGSVTFVGSGEAALPLSAGGSLNVFASRIEQGATLRAPLGSIQLGWDGTGTAPIDPITGQAFAVAESVRLLPGSETSVSAVDPRTGEALLIPYGINLNGTSWVDPRGTDITVAGQPQKSILISGKRVETLAGSSIDVRGGGDLYAYRFVSGLGGTQDLLASTTSFAVLPNYSSAFVPYAPFSDRPLTANLGTDPGYVNGTLKAGDQVFLNESSALAAGTYTLLPARYALLPGAVLVTPRTDAPNGTVALPDGSSVVAGYRTNGPADLQNPDLLAAFEVAPSATFRARAEYQDALGSDFFTAAAVARSNPIPRLPLDAGHLILSASNAMTLQGQVFAGAQSGAHGGLVDISSPVDIVIGSGAGSSAAGMLYLNAADLNKFGAESLLIGGVRQLGAGTSTVTVNTANLTLANAGTPLSLPDVILVAKENLTLASGSSIVASGSGSADHLLLGSKDVAGSGDGLLVRVSSDPGAQSTRSGGSSSMTPHMTIGAGVQLAGGSLTLDSTFATSLDPSATLRADAITLNSGQITVVLDSALQPAATEGLVLSGSALASIQAGAQSLSLLSYTSLDFYGAGQIGSATFGHLALHAGSFRGFDLGGESVRLVAGEVLLDNSAGAAKSAALGSLDGALEVQAGALRIGGGDWSIDGFSNVKMTGANGIRFEKTGTVSVAGNVTLRAPVITATRAADQSLNASGKLTTESIAGAGSLTGGLGAKLSLSGSSLSADGDILLPSGDLKLAATSGDLTLTGRLNLHGTAQVFHDAIRYTSGGSVSLVSQTGSILIEDTARIDVSAESAAGDAGAISIFAAQGGFKTAGIIRGSSGNDGRGGTFALDASTLQGSFGDLSATLNDGGFSYRRDFRFRAGDITLDGNAKAENFRLSVDSGSLTVTGEIDASGQHGGSVSLAASQNLVLESTARLNVSGTTLNNAGQGGTITLETRTGSIQLLAGAQLDLSVAGGNGGSFHLRAPQINGVSGVAIDPIESTILHASSIIAEGFFVQDAATFGDAAIENFQAAAFANATAFMANESAIRASLLSTNSALDSILHVRPGEEIVNSLGGLSLESDWDLSTWRFGATKSVVTPNGQKLIVGIEPGVLTLRARDSITLHGSISDGFGSGAGEADLPEDINGNPAPWKQLLLPLCTDGTSQASWSYRIAAGADLSAVDFRQVITGSSGSVMLGRDGGVVFSNPFGPNAVVDTAIHPNGGESLYQVIRTGAGSIEINVASDVKLLNPFATIYSAGALVSDPTLGGKFDIPRLYADPDGAEPLYPAQYSSGGGDVTITAGGNIAHETMIDGALVADPVRQLPSNWLYRRGYIDPATGTFGTALFGDVASTSWWIDFSNFFQGVGALGGGNVALTAGIDIANIDAVIPTNARMPKDATSSAQMVELGGGDLTIKAGRDIDAGVYYVERGTGTLSAGRSIHTNDQRSPNLGRITGEAPTAPETWLPTTLFAGKAQFDVSARGDLLLGPVANPFLLPSGKGNSAWYKTYFSTYGADSAVRVSSLAGSVTLRTSATLPTAGIGATTPLLLAWLENELLFDPNGDSASYYQPWLRLIETTVAPFRTAASIMPGTLQATAFSGSINLVGNFTLSPSARGTVDLVAANAINGLQPTGLTQINGVTTRNWAASTINLSDANPANVPGLLSPFAYQSLVGLDTLRLSRTENNFLGQVDRLFAESGSVQGTYAVLQTKQALHSAGPLHEGDLEPVRLLARGGDISGVTLFSGKSTQILAGRDITDIALYIQNTATEDVTVIASGRDIVAYNPNSPLRVQAQSPGNVLSLGSGTLAGDLQIGGPGMLEVLAGRHLDLGVGPNNADGTGVGIVSIGNSRNPYLPFEGASVIAAAGIGTPSSLASNKQIDFEAFRDSILATPEGLAALMEAGPEATPLTLEAIEAMSPEEKVAATVRLFFLTLRNAGRDHNNVASANFGTYNAGLAAVAAMFPKTYLGDISLTSREIKTRSGGDISLLAPGGQLLVGFDIGGNQALDQGILTEDGGNISIFTNGSVIVGTSRIFTLRGGDEIIWSSAGDIAAGASSKTVQSAPPTRVLVDPQSANVETDLAGLATGGGIGVLATVANIPPGNVDLIAPTGTIDAGDAGIRATGNLNFAAVVILNANNTSAGGSTTGAPAAPSVAAPNIAGLAAASSSAGATASAATDAAQQNRPAPTSEDAPSIINVEVSFSTDSAAAATNQQAREEEERRRRAASPSAQSQ